MVNVFISSTSIDLADYREAAINTCLKLGLFPLAMENFEVAGIGATEGSKRKLDQAHVYVGIYAHRYGTIEPGYDHSVTEIEFDYAGQCGLDRLCFLIDPDHDWPFKFVDMVHHEKLKTFKERISQQLIRGQFTTVDNFQLQLIQALSVWKQEHPDTNVDETLSTAPQQPEQFVGRADDVAAIKARLGVGDEQDRHSLTVIRGWPGVGKTTLITALAHDPQVIAAFPGGVLWTGLGETPDVLAKLADWATALGIKVTTANHIALINALREQLAKKRMLLIVDDVWNSDDVAPFQQVIGAQCAMLVTTRRTDIAYQIARKEQDVYFLQQLDDDSGLQLLNLLAPTVVSEYTIQCRSMIHELEGLPLAIHVAGRWLNRELQTGFSLDPLFEQISKKFDLLSHLAPDDRFDPETGTTPTISLILEKSTNLLDEETRYRFAFLGAFAPKPATFELSDMADCWSVTDPKPTVRSLVDLGLLEHIRSSGRFQLHAVLVMHARSMLGDDDE